MLRYLFGIISLIQIVFLSEAQHIFTPQDSLYCFVLKNDMYNSKNLSRAQFMMNIDSICVLKKFSCRHTDKILDRLKYLHSVEYNTNQFALDWEVSGDSIISLRSKTKPVRALLVRYTSTFESQKKYNQSNIVSLIWVTTETVDIDNKEYQISSELYNLLFK